MKHFILPMLCLGALVSSCKKEGPQGPQGPAGPSGSASTGTLSGKVRQYDEYGIAKSSGLNSTTVSVEGTNLSTVTDASGNYTITDVPAGVYSLRYEKPAAGTNKITQVTFPGNGNLYHTAYIADKSTMVIKTALVKDTFMGTYQSVAYKLSFDPVPQPRACLLVFAKTPNIDLADPNSYKYEYRHNITSGLSNVNEELGLLNSFDNDFPSGSTVYVKLYPISRVYGDYYDPALDKSIYTGYGTPFPTTFTITAP